MLSSKTGNADKDVDIDLNQEEQRSEQKNEPSQAEEEDEEERAAKEAKIEIERLAKLEANLNFSARIHPKIRRFVGLPQIQTATQLAHSKLPPLEDPSHLDFSGVDLRRCWARFLPVGEKVFYDKIILITEVVNAASGPSETYGADGTAQIIQRGQYIT